MIDEHLLTLTALLLFLGPLFDPNLAERDGDLDRAPGLLLSSFIGLALFLWLSVYGLASLVL
jgi:hypothetical protein